MIDVYEDKPSKIPNAGWTVFPSITQHPSKRTEMSRKAIELGLSKPYRFKTKEECLAKAAELDAAIDGVWRVSPYIMG